MSERQFGMITPAVEALREERVKPPLGFPVDWNAKTRTSGPETFEEMFDILFAEARLLVCEKQADYGPGNIAAFGEFGILVRANDKMERLKNLLDSDAEPANESIEDSWRDLLNYAAIALAVRRGWWTKTTCPPLEADL